jgi:translation initiation factor eIF-2B subunit delta
MKKEGQSFSVILIDSAPLFEGRSLLPSLTAHGIPCTYGLLPSLPSLLARTDLVLLGTNAVLGDGACYSRAGTASVAMLAKGMGKPVLVCSETYKFVEKIQLDPLVANELGPSTPSPLYLPYLSLPDSRLCFRPRR